MMNKDTVPCSAHVASTVKNSQVLWKRNFKSAKMEVKTAFSLSTKFKFERTLQRHCFLIYSTDFVRLTVSSYFTWVHPSCKVQQGFKHICFFLFARNSLFFPFLNIFAEMFNVDTPQAYFHFLLSDQTKYFPKQINCYLISPFHFKVLKCLGILQVC